MGAGGDTLGAAVRGRSLRDSDNPRETDALHFLDVVRGRPRATDLWDVLELVSRSGHSTIRLTFSEGATHAQREEVLTHLERLVGNAEHMEGEHWAVDLKPGADVEAA